jgi:hypothetical protein
MFLPAQAQRGQPMTDGRIEPDIQRAVAACVRSVEELEVLLFLARDRRYCSADTIAGALGLPARSVATALESMASRNLLDVRIAQAVLYKLDPASKTSAAYVELTLEAAWRDRTSVLKAILSGRSAAQDFADAFRVTKKDRSDG